jgi:hypothetical protein
MIARLVLFVLGYAMLLAMPMSALAYMKWPELQAWWQERRLRLQGERNVRLLKAYEVQLCRFCDEPTTNADCYEPKKGWYHIRCLQALLG